MRKDFLPKSWTAFADWLANFYNQLVNGLAAKYGVTAKMTQLERDKTWVQYWVPAKFASKQQLEQLNEYVDGIANGAAGSPPPTDPAWALPENPPANVPPGIKARIREIAATGTPSGNGQERRMSIRPVCASSL